MLTARKNKVFSKGRILYVEPNDVFGDLNGAPLTPDYTDMCISFDLIVDVVSRYKQNMTGNNETNTYCISWVSNINENNENEKNGVPNHHWVSFLQGKDGFLSTYYTDAQFEVIRKENIVEGLGVEYISVSFENYYTPTVTIKFVDVRGMSLFGREEAIHYNDKLTIDNIFGAFFTAPYPKFKLQIKGFYGKPVTLQLTCSGFKGMLNPNTGNFEATATFIGYTYSLLTDVPFQYIVAAPYCDYVGKEYWENKCNSDEWAPIESDGKPLPKIYDFVTSLLESLTKDDLLKLVSGEDEKNVQNNTTEIAELEKIMASFNKFLEELGKQAEITLISQLAETPAEDVKEQLLLLSNKETVDFSDAVREAYNVIVADVKAYNEAHKDVALKPESQVLGGAEKFESAKFEPFLRNMNGMWGFVKNAKAQLNDSQVLCKELSDKVTEMLKNSDNGLRTNGYIVSLGDFRKVIIDRKSKLNKTSSEIKNRAERDYIAVAQANLGMVPYIGNIFKMIMAHIDTLVYMMLICYENILSQQSEGFRTANYLKIEISSTDLEGANAKTSVPPWPGITSVIDKNKAIQTNSDSIGWVGDFSHNFEEEKLVRSLFLACKRVTNKSGEESLETKKITYIPVAPFDVNQIEAVFSGFTDSDISALGGMLGTRIAQLFGVMMNGDTSAITLAPIMGRMDSYNYFMQIRDKEQFKTSVLDTPNLSSVMINIMTCDKSADNYGKTEPNAVVHHTFESYTLQDESGNPRFNGRHPIFVKDGTVLKYVHFFNECNRGIIPTEIRLESNYVDTIKISNNNTHFAIHTAIKSGEYAWNNSVIHVGKDIDMLPKNNSNNNSNNKYQQYLNGEMFSLEVRPEIVGGIIDRYNELKSGSFKIYDKDYKEDFKGILDKYWADVSNADDFVYKYASILSCPRDIVGIKDNNILSYNNVLEPSFAYSGDEFIDFKVRYDNSKWVYTKDKNTEEISLDKTVVRDIPISVNGVQVSLFGSVAYYSKTSKYERAHLFLECCVGKMLNNGNFVNKFNKALTSVGVHIVPYSYALYLGSLLLKREKGESVNVPENIDYHVENELIKKFKEFVDVDFARIRKHLELTKKENTSVTGGDIETYCDTLCRIKPLGINQKNTDSILRQNNVYSNTNFLSGTQSVDLTSSQTTVSNANSPFTSWTTPSIIPEFKPDYIQINGNVPYLLSGFVNDNFSNFYNNYYYIRGKFENNGKTPSTKGFLLHINESNADLQRLLKKIAVGKAAILNMTKGTTNRDSNSTDVNVSDISVTEDVAKAYLEGFFINLKTIIGGKTVENNSESSTESESNAENTNSGDVVQSDSSSTEAAIQSSNNEEVGDETSEFTRDIALPIYLYLKMLWDKWLVNVIGTPESNEYSVGNFYNNFVFIDSFYRNISGRMMINCQLFLNIYENNNASNRDASVFKVIGDIAGKHNCLFMPVPDFVSDIADNEPNKAKESLESMFVPMPYSGIQANNNNKFVVIYVPKFSEIPSALNGFREDSFNIWSYNDSVSYADTNIDSVSGDYSVNDSSLPPILWKINGADNGESSNMTEYGFYVPSFGITYGRQSNSIFKALNLSMETPVMTSTVINTLAHITTTVNYAANKVAYVGQDLYPVFSNYSYICEFEMMGCAQIQPLMYFQLMNVPMWRGTYMIINVSHTMRPGTMTTQVRAMKLSNRAVPYSKTWYTKNFNYDPAAAFDVICVNFVGGVSSTSASTSVSDSGTSEYSELPEGSYDAVKGDFSGLVTNPKMKKILSDTSWAHSTDLGDYILGTWKEGSYTKKSHVLVTGKCTSGPKTWYSRAGINLRFWVSIYTSSYKETNKYMQAAGLECIWHGTKEDWERKNNSGLRPGDVATLYPTGSSHGAMWTGVDWRSDHLQNQKLWCYSGRGNRGGNYTVCIWRHPDLQ